MSEENMMSEENKKTVISFIAGLLVGGLLVFIFSEPPADAVKKSDDEAYKTTDVSGKEDNTNKTNKEVAAAEQEEVVMSTTPADIIVSDSGSIVVADQPAGTVVELDAVELPSRAGWIGVRDYENGQLSGLLGVVRFNTDEALLPDSVHLLRSTEAGKTYAVVFYSDNGDKTFSLATDGQFSGVMETFKAE